MIQINIALEDSSGSVIPSGSIVDFTEQFGGNLTSINFGCNMLHYRSLLDKDNGKSPLILPQYEGAVETPNGVAAGNAPYIDFNVVDINNANTRSKIENILLPLIAARFNTDIANVIVMA